MKIVQEQILFDCLAQFEAGVPVEELVAKYPQAAAEIKKFLATAVYLQSLNLQPSLAAKKQSQKQFLQTAAHLRAKRRKAWFSWGNLQRTLLPLASLAMVTVLVGVTFLFASASALPGDLLYSPKRWVEALQLEQAGDDTAVFNLQTQLNQERIREIKAILRTNQPADVSFEGRINTMQGSSWVIAGIPVHQNEQTLVEGNAAVGALVRVNGRTQNGHLYASRIIVLQEVPATTAPSPSPTAWPTATSTATSSPTAAPTATTTATATAGATTTSTPTADPTGTTPSTGTPTASATPAATVPPTETAPPPTAVPPTATTQPTSVPTAVVNNDNDNDNEGSNDNSNENEGNENSGGNENENNNGGNENGNDNSSNDNNNDNSENGNDNSNDNDDDNENDNGSSGSGGGNDNENDNNGNENGRREDG